MPPIAARLEDRRPRQAAMGEQRGLAERRLAGARLDRRRDARQFAEQHILAAQRQRDERRTRLEHFQTELPRQENGRAAGRERGGRYVSVSVVAGSLKKKIKKEKTT